MVVFVTEGSDIYERTGVTVVVCVTEGSDIYERTGATVVVCVTTGDLKLASSQIVGFKPRLRICTMVDIFPKEL